MTSFSERQGIRQPKSVLQVGSMDADLRTGLWNGLSIFYWNKWNGLSKIEHSQSCMKLCVALWLDFFKSPIDDMPAPWETMHHLIRKFFFSQDWNRIYDFIEFVVANYPNNLMPGATKDLVPYINAILERELSGYRLVGEHFTPITSEQENQAIADAVNVPDTLKPVREHIDAALQKLSDRGKPDYRTSIKESISAVEALCQLIAGKRATLGDALKTIERKIPLHGALKQAFSNLYGYTSNAEGIRHALLDEPTLAFEDAKFMLVSCAAFVNYLVAKAATAGLKL